MDDVIYRVGRGVPGPTRILSSITRRRLTRIANAAMTAGWLLAFALLIAFLVATVNVPSITDPDTPRWTYVSEVR